MDRLTNPKFAPWWWLYLPLAIIVALPIINHAAPEFYQRRMLPEGYGVLELSHFFIPLVGFFLGVRLLFNPIVRAKRLWWYLILLGTLACFYTAGEEHSWGQHFFNWETPEEWSQINRQHETNLHNVHPAFNMLPRAVLELAIFVCGLLLPLLAWLGRPLRIKALELFEPSVILVPVSIGALIYKLDSMFQKELGFDGTDGLVTRPAEAAETFYVLFMLYYLILIQRRVDEMAQQA
ncbi:hypothetical protein [Hyphomicrobium sulfonivorans]|uniref:hypothetical protein n=1 Tax=Hyphomicrobium sulfonivorans TaxID=121290 RepID=UPI00156E0968|nr:hypothetical protein [Hyphomicrobium sulfonivorans]MBI1651328.1 hypothetical protein [Hyphomicrobium sulfonivorans]NSL72779.1 hypothetical protein [Hyphomicrobium sulfonivorans]